MKCIHYMQDTLQYIEHDHVRYITIYACFITAYLPNFPNKLASRHACTFQILYTQH